MNLMIITNGVMEGIGGSEKFLVDLLNGLPKDGFDTTLTCIDDGLPSDNLKDIVRETGVRFIVCPYKKSHKLDAASIIRLRRLIVRLKIDVIHANSGYAAIAGSLSRIGLNTRLVYLVHEEHIFSWKTRLFFLFLRPLITEKVSVSQNVAKAIEDSSFIIPDRKIDRVICNGVDLNKFIPMDSEIAKERLGLNGMLVIGSVGRLINRKGYSYLIEAVAQLKYQFPLIKLVLLGEGPEESRLKKLADELRISESVLFLGTRQNVPEILSAFDVFVLPSLSEALPIALLEAAAMGKPLVASNVAGNGEIVYNGKNGFLVPPRNVKALVQAITLIIEDSDRAEKMGIEARTIVQQNFSVDRMVRDYIKLYNDLLFYP